MHFREDLPNSKTFYLNRISLVLFDCRNTQSTRRHLSQFNALSIKFFAISRSIKSCRGLVDGSIRAKALSVQISLAESCWVVVVVVSSVKVFDSFRVLPVATQRQLFQYHACWWHSSKQNLLMWALVCEVFAISLVKYARWERLRIERDFTLEFRRTAIPWRPTKFHFLIPRNRLKRATTG